MLCRGWGYTASRGCETVASVASGRGVSFSSSSLGLSCAFSSTWECGQLTGVFAWAARDRRSLLIVEEVDGGGCGWGSEGLRGWSSSSSLVRKGGQKGQGMQWAASLGFTHQRHSALWWFRLPPQAAHLQSSSRSPILSGCFLTANLSPLPWSALWTPHFSTQHLSAVVDVPLRLGGQGSGEDPVCRSLSLSCCHMRFAMFSPTENEALLLSKLSSLMRGFPLCGDLFSLSSPHRVAGPIPLPLLFLFLLLSLVLPGSAGIFLVSLDF